MEKKIMIGELVGLGVLAVLSIWSFITDITTKRRNNKRLDAIEDKLGIPHEVKKEKKSKKDKDAKEDKDSKETETKEDEKAAA